MEHSYPGTGIFFQKLQGDFEFSSEIFFTFHLHKTLGMPPEG